MSLKALATSTCSLEPVRAARACRSPAGDAPGGACEAAQGPRERARQGPGQPQPEREHGGAQREQGDDVAAHLRAHRLHALGEAHRAGGASGLDDGDRGE